MDALAGIIIVLLAALVPLSLFVWACNKFSESIRKGREERRQSREYWHLKKEHRVAMRALKIKHREEIRDLKAKQDKEISLIYKC